MSQTCPKIFEKCPKTCPEHVRKCPKNLRKYVPNISENVRKMSENVSRTYPKIFRNLPKIRHKFTLGRTRNRTQYPPDPTPAPVRVQPHWANPVTTNRVSMDLLCIRIRDRKSDVGFFKTKKNTFLKNKHCAYVVYARRGVISLRKATFEKVPSRRHGNS